MTRHAVILNLPASSYAAVGTRLQLVAGTAHGGLQNMRARADEAEHHIKTRHRKLNESLKSRARSQDTRSKALQLGSPAFFCFAVFFF